MTTTKKIIAIISPEYSGNKLFDGGLASFLDKFISFDKHFFAYPYGQIFYNYDKKLFLNFD